MTDPITITLDGKTRELKPSPEAAIKISRFAGGLVTAAKRIQSLDLDAIVATVAAGLDLTARGAENLEQRVWDAGLGGENGLAVPLTRYVDALANGGVPSGDARGAADE